MPAVRRLLLPLVALALAGCSGEDAPPSVDPGTLPYFQRLTSSSAAETAPAFSPDGARLVYERNSEIWILEVASRVATRVAARGNHPSWSSDGASIVFVRRDVAGAGLIHRLIRMSLGSGVVDTVSTDSVDVYEPAASPTGSAVALRNLSRVNRVQSLRVVRGDGEDLATLTAGGAWVDTSPAWSPDGAWIAFVRVEDAGTTRLMRVPASGGGIASFVAGDTNGASGPTWHPDGRIFFARAGVISSIAAAGGTVVPYVQGAGFELEPAISPDGKRLVFTTDRTGNTELWMLVDPNGLGSGPYAY
jgi:TolB protein